MDKVEEADVLFGMEWNEIESFPSDANRVLVAIACTGTDRVPIQIGTGFIIVAGGDRALVVTAAHVISEGVKVFQNSSPRRRRAPSALDEFFAPEEVSAASSDLHVILAHEDGAHACSVGFVAWDETADLAFLAVVPQNESSRNIFETALRLATSNPEVGDLIGVIGYSEMSTEPHSSQNTSTLTRRGVMRAGRVLCMHDDGYMRVQVPCIDASMPTFSGMSGGPAFILTPNGDDPRPFGILSRSAGASSDVGAMDLEAFDRSKQTRPSTFAIIPREISPPAADGNQLATIKFTMTGVAINPEIDQARTSGLMTWYEDP